jgi:hypothetical protein
MLRYIAFLWIAFAATMGFFAGGSVSSTFFTPVAAQQQGATTKIDHANQQTIEERHEATEEAIAYYNKWLMFFTAALAVATIVLGSATVALYLSAEKQFNLTKDSNARQAVEIQNQIDIARISARAADDSAKAAIAAERARFFIIIKGHNLHNALETLGRYPNSPTMPLSFEPLVQYAFKNYGKTPGIIREVSHGLAVHEGPPDPVYVVSRHLFVEHMIAAGGETEMQKFDGPVLFETIADGLPILSGQKHFWFYGRFDYEDVFGNPQTHRFLMRYVKTGQKWGFQPYDHRHYNQST